MGSMGYSDSAWAQWVIRIAHLCGEACGGAAARHQCVDAGDGLGGQGSDHIRAAPRLPRGVGGARGGRKGPRGGRRGQAQGHSGCAGGGICRRGGGGGSMCIVVVIVQVGVEVGVGVAWGGF